MLAKIKAHTKFCETCVALKPDLSFKPSRSITSTLPHPWTSVQSDIKGPLGLTLSGNKYIITFVCELTRYSFICPLKSKEASSIVKALSDIISENGPMLSLMTDNGAEYKNSQLQEFLSELKITHKFSTPYRPQSNSHAERLNREISKFFKIFASQSDNWDDDLKLIQYAVNNQYNRSLGCSPWAAWHGWMPNIPSYLTFPKESNIKTFNNLRFYMSQRIMNHKLLLDSIFDLERTRKNDNFKPPVDLPIGQKVLMYFPQPVGETKLFQNWKSIFKIVKKLDNDSYLVSSENDPRKTYIVYRGRLKPVGSIEEQPVVGKEVSEPGSKIISAEEEEKVELETFKRYNLRKRFRNDYKSYFE